MTQSHQVISAPFISQGQSVGAIMRLVIYALVPGIVLAFYFFGWGVLTNIIVACVSALFWEAVMLVIRDRSVKLYLSDGSAIVTGILLGVALPPLVPWWLLFTGTFFAIVAAKQLYGGLGYNPLNPAMAGYAVLLISFPLEMGVWLSPVTMSGSAIGFLDAWNWVLFKEMRGGLNFDALTAATPLDQLRTEISRGVAIDQVRQSAEFGLFAGKGVEWINVGFLVGGLWLSYKKIISWQIPVAILSTLTIVSAILYFYSPDRFVDPFMHLFCGATMLCAFFIATDPVSASTTPLGKLIYGISIGLLIFIIRTWGGYPDAVAFAVLLMNLTAPLLDQYTVPRAFGAKHGHTKDR